MSEFPYQHCQGHLVAQVIEETADEITINYQHITDLDWGGIVTLSKHVFTANYTLCPSPLSEGGE